MKLKRWLMEREAAWSRTETLLKGATQSVYQLPPPQIRELSLLYRSLMNDLSRVRSVKTFHYLLPYLNNLAVRTHTRVCETPPTDWMDVLHFFTTTFPICFRRNIRYIGLAFLTFLTGTIIAMLTMHWDPTTQEYFLPAYIIEMVKQGHIWTEGMNAAPSESTFLMSNNIKVAITAFAAGLFFGVGTLLVMFQNGMIAFGGPLAICLRYGVADKLILFMLPHGILELSTIMIAGGAGMMLGFSLLFPGEYSRWDAVKIKGRDAMILIMGCIPMLVIAGCIEGMVSLNPNVSEIPRITIALASAVLLFLYLTFSGLNKAINQQAQAKA